MTKTLDSNISDILQSNSAVEYVEPRENPIATIPNDERSVRKSADTSIFNFKAEHNGEACIESLRPEDKGTERQFWFTAKMLCEIFDVARKTLEDNIQSLSDDGEFSMAEFRHTEKVPASDGKLYETTIYNLEVLNKLGMCCFRGNQKAKEIRNKFNDVLVKYETKTQPQFILPTTYIEALEALVESEKAKLALQAERDEALKASDQSFKARATAMGRLSNIRFRENDVRASERMAAYGHPSRNKKFTVQNVMDAAWFQLLFKASQSERFYNGNPAWKPLIKSLKRLLSLKANNVVRHELENRFHEELSSTKAKKVFSLWMRAKEGGTPFHESLADINLGEMAVSLGNFIDELVCLSERYEYTRSNGDSAYGMVYGYAYDVWARVLSSLYFREIEDYLRDTSDPEDFDNTLYSVRSECYGLI